MITRRAVFFGGVPRTGSVALHWRASSVPAAPFPVTRSDAEWRKLLTPERYAVLRQSATERPFSSPLLDEYRAGIFGCAGCDRGLFSREAKFDSGTGWPSFWSPLKEAVMGKTTDTSLGMVRTAVHCAGCGGHLGHVFNDGPPVTGLRYCINGVAMASTLTAVASSTASACIS